MRHCRLRVALVVVIAGNAAAVAAGGAAAAPSPARFAVTFSATQTSTFGYDECAPNVLTMNAELTSLQPITATVTHATLTFVPDLAMHRQQLQTTATMTQAACPGLATAKSCGPTTGMIKPGLRELTWSAGKLTARYQSGSPFFAGADSCSSGIIEMGSAYPDTSAGTALLNPSTLLKKKVTEISGSWQHTQAFTGHGHDGAEHTVVAFTVRFVRLP
jgi:hypothetical protein